MLAMTGLEPDLIAGVLLALDQELRSRRVKVSAGVSTFLLLELLLARRPELQTFLRGYADVFLRQLIWLETAAAA
jgi:hypothetical protein